MLLLISRWAGVAVPANSLVLNFYLTTASALVFYRDSYRAGNDEKHFAGSPLLRRVATVESAVATVSE
jgi:hypothetical protein